MPLIIPFFLMNRGCPHRCVFCNERLTAGNHPEQISREAFVETVGAHLASAKGKGGPPEIAFYGGTFTGMERTEQSRLLELAAPFLREGTVAGIRISTRPDSIDSECCDFLRRFGVTTVEVGAQSLDEEVLLRSRRGHTAADTGRALLMLKEWGFKSGLHVMAGLPGESPDRFKETIARVIALRPDTVRIHPTLVLRGTPLAEEYRRGDYLPLSLAEGVDRCKAALRALTAAGIPVIRLGLQTTRELEEPGAILAGPFHPAFRTLVETALFLEMATALLEAAGSGDRLPDETGALRESIQFAVSPADISGFCGYRRENVAALKHRFHVAEILVASDPALPRLTLALRAGRKVLRTNLAGQIEDLAFSR
ncbi:MAG: radical SAM protein [Deltaproteobacteria bacterium]|nr:radical SAM protein [Deltaproteobacteria bacterium]